MLQHFLRLSLAVVTLATTGASAAPSTTYSLPWQLRPTAASNVVRSDTAFAFYEGADGANGFTTASMLFASYKVIPSLAPFVRLALVQNSLGDSSGVTLVNPAFGATWSQQLNDDFRLALFLGLTAPIGMGGGNSPDPVDAATTRAGVFARSSMDNAMFAVNDFTVFPGVGLSWNRGPVTAQVEATVFQLTRVRGEEVQKDASRTNFTSGLHLGWFPHPVVSIGAELRYQRWLSTPVAVEANPELRDTLTVAAGPRLHLKAGGLTFRPGVALALPLDDPMRKQDYTIVQLDIPVAF